MSGDQSFVNPQGFSLGRVRKKQKCQSLQCSLLAREERGNHRQSGVEAMEGGCPAEGFTHPEERKQTEDIVRSLARWATCRTKRKEKSNKKRFGIWFESAPRFKHVRQPTNHLNMIPASRVRLSPNYPIATLAPKSPLAKPFGAKKSEKPRPKKHQSEPHSCLRVEVAFKSACIQHFTWAA